MTTRKISAGQEIFKPNVLFDKHMNVYVDKLRHGTTFNIEPGCVELKQKAVNAVMHEFTDGIQSCIFMAAAALAVKNTAIEALITENEYLRKENEQLISLATAKGGEQVPALLKQVTNAQLDVQHAQLEVQQLKVRLQEETEVREDLERELEDTAAAAQELWESMQAVYSEAADSRAHSLGGSQADSDDEWGTPPGATSPTAARAPSPLERSLAAAAAAAMAATAAAQRRSAAAAAASSAAAAAVDGIHTAEVVASTPIAKLPAAAVSVRPAAPSDAAVPDISAAVAAIQGGNAPLTGILTPLESKMASLSHKLMGLVSWLDARDTSSPGSTPRSAHAAPGSSHSHHRVSPLPLGSPISSLGLGSPLQGALGDAAATPDSAKGVNRSAGSKRVAGSTSANRRRGLSPRISPRFDLAKSLGTAAAVAAAGKPADQAVGVGLAHSSAIDVAREKDGS